MKQKVVIITGASKGIGAEIAKVLASNEYYVILLGRSKKLLEDQCEYIKEHNGNAEHYSVDLTDCGKTATIIGNIYNKIKCIDVLVDCAGIGCFGQFTEIKQEDFEGCISLNVNSVFNITKLVAKKMKIRRKGQIINIGSIAGEKGFRYGAGYVSSKFAIEGLSQVLWEELKKYEIKVCVVRPGLINSSFYDNMTLDEDDKENMEMAPNTLDLAEVVNFIINQPENMNISNVTLRPIKKNAQNLFVDILEKAHGFI